MAERFLVVKLADVGDALTATPALRALRTSFPGARVDVLTTAAGAAALAGLDSLDDLLVFDKARFDRLALAAGPALAAGCLAVRLHRARYDRVFLLHHLFTPAGRLKYAALLVATGSTWRGGLAEVRPPYLTHVAPDLGYGVRHEADYWLDVVGLSGAINPRPRLEIAVGPADDARASRLLDGSRAGGHRVALYPGSGPYSLARRWPADRYAELGRRLVAALGPDTEVLVVGADAERGLAGDVGAAIGPPARNLAGQTDLKALAALLRRCDLFVGNDGGAMHVAVAAGTPVVAVFGPTNHVSWGPYVPEGGASSSKEPPLHRVARVDLPCAPCLYRGFLPGARDGCRARDCLKLLTVERVVEAVLAMLRENPGEGLPPPPTPSPTRGGGV